MLFDLVEGDNPTLLRGEQLVPDALHFAAELQVGLKTNDPELNE